MSVESGKDYFYWILVMLFVYMHLIKIGRKVANQLSSMSLKRHFVVFYLVNFED